jgi:hypothetical protein
MHVLVTVHVSDSISVLVPVYKNGSLVPSHSLIAGERAEGVPILQALCGAEQRGRIREARGLLLLRPRVRSTRVPYLAATHAPKGITGGPRQGDFAV